LTRTADLKRRLQEATGRSEDLDTLVDAMRYGTDEVSTMLLARLRLGEPLEDLVTALRTETHFQVKRDHASMQSPLAQSGELER
jgi:hypothetical protein